MTEHYIVVRFQGRKFHVHRVVEGQSFTEAVAHCDDRHADAVAVADALNQATRAVVSPPIPASVRREFDEVRLRLAVQSFLAETEGLCWSQRTMAALDTLRSAMQEV